MEEDTTYKELFVGGLLPRTTGTGLRDYFQQFGTVAEANVVKDRHGNSKGFGFVTFVNPQDAAIACQNQFHIIDGKTINCNLAAIPVEISKSSSPILGPRMPFGGAVPHLSSSPSVRSPNYPMYRAGPMHGSGLMYGPGPMYGVPPVYPYGQTSGRNERGTGNTSESTQATSNTSQNGQPNGQSSGSNGHSNGNTPVTNQTTLNTSQNGQPIYGPRSMTGLPQVYANNQSSGSNGSATGNNPVSIQITCNAGQNGGDREEEEEQC